MPALTVGKVIFLCIKLLLIISLILENILQNIEIYYIILLDLTKNRGFAVAADEVRNIASKSAEAANTFDERAELDCMAVEIGNIADVVQTNTAAAEERERFSMGKKSSTLIA